MQISSRFTIAVHILTAIEYFQKDYKVTSDFLAASVNVNPVVIRRTMSQLKNAGLIHVARGTGGATIAKPLDQITLLDVFNAVDSIENNTLFHFHDNPNTACPVGRNIHHGLDDKLEKVQDAMEDELKAITLADVVNDTEKYIAKEEQ